MPAPLYDSTTPAIHRRLLEPVTVERLRAGWDGVAPLRIEDALRPGLAAELVPLANSLPHIAGAGTEPRCVVWGSELQVPELDAQYPLCLFELSRLVDRDVPMLLEALTGRPHEPVAPRRLRVWRLRKGCFVDAGQALPGYTAFILGLNGPVWPAKWGGHVAVPGGDQATVLPPGSGTLDLIPGGRFAIPLIERQVEAIMVTGMARARD